MYEKGTLKLGKASALSFIVLLCLARLLDNKYPVTPHTKEVRKGLKNDAARAELRQT